jgi:HK97 family phage major capsid protein
MNYGTMPKGAIMAEEKQKIIIEVEAKVKEPAPAQASTGVKLLKKTDDVAVVGGYGVIFGGKDLVGEAFSKYTDFMLDAVPSKVVTYDHALQEPIKHFIGKTIKEEITEKGIWIEAQLDRAKEYVDEVLSLVEDGALGWSSGTVGHLIEMQGNLIKRWPVFEYALTPTPAEPRTLSAERIKSLEDAYPEMGINYHLNLHSQDAGASKEDASSSANLTIKSENLSEVEMSEELNEVEETQEEQEKQPEMNAADIASAVADALRPEIQEMVGNEVKAFAGEKKQKPETNVAPNQMKHAHLGDPDPSQDFWNFIATGKGKIKKHWNNEAELPHITYDAQGMKSVHMVKAALQEGTDSEGGYLVPAGELGRIIEKRDELALLPRVGASVFTTDRDVYNVPAEDTAMTDFTIVAEEGNVSAAQNEPDFAQVAVTIYKFMKVILMSAEIEEDFNSGLAGFLTQAIGRSWASTENIYVQNGTGSSQPQGVFVGGTAGLTLDSASAIGAGEIPELIGKLKQSYRDSAAMLMNRTTAAYLRGLTGNQFVFAAPPVGSIQATGEDLGIGYPVYPTEDAAAIAASAKSLLFGNFSYYAWVRNQSLKIERMGELYRATDQIGLHCKFRAGGAVLQAEAFQYASHPSA